MKIAVLGAGMYVTGRGAGGYGTRLSALAEWSRNSPLEAVTVIGRGSEARDEVEAAAKRINDRLHTHLAVGYLSASGDLGEGLLSLIKGEAYAGAIICLPDHLHRQAFSVFASAGVHCLVVKPMAPSLAEARAMCDDQRRFGVVGMVEFHKRFDESNLLIRRMVRAGDLGRLAYFAFNFSQQRRIPLTVFRKWAAKTNVFQYLGVHYVDLVYFITGARPVRAMAVGTRGVLRSLGADLIDSVHAVVVWQHPDDYEFIAQYNVNWIDPDTSSALSDQRYVLLAEKARLDLDQKNRGVEIVLSDGPVRSINPYFSEFLAAGGEGGTVFQGYAYSSIRKFLDVISDVRRGRRDLGSLENGEIPTLREGVVSTAVVEAVTRSLGEQGQWVNVELSSSDRQSSWSSKREARPHCL
jgi:predicted dehydrogenase